MWLGVRCWKDKIALVAVDDGDPPTIVHASRPKAPATDDPGLLAAWFGRSLTEALGEADFEGVAVRIADRDPTQERAQAEGAVLAAAAEAGLQTVTLRRQSMLKPLEVPSGRGEWAKFPKEDPFFGALVGDEKDAAMASLAATRR